ncbi:MAG: hypothetical protein U0T36_09940 [Saprospiraceae bacterium]|jgi:hypothetical protein
MPFELSSNHLFQIVLVLEQNFGLQNDISLDRIIIIENDSLFSLKPEESKYIKSKIEFIQNQNACCEINQGKILVLKFSQITKNNRSDYDFLISFQILGTGLTIYGTLNINFGLEGQDILPIYRQLFYTSFSSE